MTHVSKQILLGNQDFFPIKPADYGKFMVLSLGTGSTKVEEKFDVMQCSKWGILGWLYNKGTTPIIDSFSQANVDLHYVKYHFQGRLQCICRGGSASRPYARVSTNHAFVGAARITSRPYKQVFVGAV